jgi:2'-5' RNA ligase
VESPAWTYTNATEMRDHWWWRPGWAVGRRFYTWHFTFEGQEELHKLVSAYQEALAGVATLDLVPLRWLHLTVQGLGFADEVDKRDLVKIDAAVASHLEELPTPVVAFERPVIRPEAIALPPTPIDSLREVKAAIRRGIADVWGHSRVPEQLEGFQPHVTVAYSSGEGDVGGIISRLEAVNVMPARVELRFPQRITLQRDHRIYEWI